MEKAWIKFRRWVKANPWEFGVLFIILLIAAFLRLYKIDQYMTFLGDEGRDVIIVKRLLSEGHTPLIGPGTSVGQMYLGPLYYYMMAPALWIANYSPVGPAVQIALLGVVTVGFIWWIGKEWFGRVAGFVAATFYAVSPSVIISSRSSWNPNIMPFFALLCIFAVWKVWKKREFGWLTVLGISFAFVMQSHYLGILLFPTLALFLLLTYRKLRSNEKWKMEIGNLTKKFRLALGFFLFLMSPLLIFDLRHNFQNFRAFMDLFAMREGVANFSTQALVHISERFSLINGSLLAARNETVGLTVSLAILFLILFLYAVRFDRISKPKLHPAYFILFSWIGFGILGLAFYKLPIYDHYFGFLFPAPFFLIGGLSEDIRKHAKHIGKYFVYLLLAVLLYINLRASPLQFEPNRQLQRSQNVARKVLAEQGGKPFDLAVLAERNYEDGYRYFLELWGGTVLHADVWDKSTIVDDLIAICEMEEEKCDPTHSPKAEVANFGMSKIDTQWEVDGVIIYRLLHSEP